MAENENGPYQPGTYRKDGQPDREVETVRDAVQASFDGFTRVQEDSDVEGGFAADNDNDPESPLADHRSLNEDFDFEQKAEFSDDQADVLEDGPVTEGEHPQFDDETVSDTAATPDSPSGEPVDRSNPRRSFSL